jgi:hypothetical protein
VIADEVFPVALVNFLEKHEGDDGKHVRKSGMNLLDQPSCVVQVNGFREITLSNQDIKSVVAACALSDGESSEGAPLSTSELK